MTEHPLKAWRKSFEPALRLRHIAEVCDCVPSTVFKWESNKAEPKFGQVKKLNEFVKSKSPKLSAFDFF